MLPISLMVDGGGFHHQFRDTLGDANRALEAVNTHEVLRRGAKLEPWEAERLERILDEFDGAARLRGHLVGYYLLRERASADRTAALKHVLRIIENAAATDIAAKAAWLCVDPLTSGSWLGLQQPWLQVYVRAASNEPTAELASECLDPINESRNRRAASNEPRAELASECLGPINESWNRALAAQAGNTRVMGRAAEYYMNFDRVTAGRLLRDARTIEPDNPQWTQRIATLYDVEFQSRRDESRPDWAAMALAEWERALSECTEATFRYDMLWRAGICALEANELEKARSLGQQFLDATYDSFTGEWARHFGHQLLGRLELKSGGVEQAKVHLSASITSTAGGYLRVAGPRVTLAKELLQRGETQIVVKYFRDCANICRRAHPEYARWADQLERGQTPDIYAEP
jgi:hypothetical protein